MRFSTKVTTGVAAAGAVALGVGLLAFAPGVGAAFTDSASATANINVGRFACNLSSSDPDVSVHSNTDGTQTATVSLGEINSSTAGSETAPVTLTNAGSMNLMANWSVGAITGTLPSSSFAASPAPATVLMAPGNTQNANLGFNWTALDNAALGTSGSVTYTVSCTEAAPENLLGIDLFADGATGESSATWNTNPDSVALEVHGTTKAPAYPYGPSAGFDLLNVAAGSGLPSSEPGLTSNYYGSNGPRLALLMSNGKYIYGHFGEFATYAQPTYSWEIQTDASLTAPTSPSENGGYWDWSQVTGYVSTNHLTVQSAFVVMDNNAQSNDFKASVTCFNYGGTPLFGTGC